MHWWQLKIHSWKFYFCQIKYIVLLIAVHYIFIFNINTTGSSRIWNQNEIHYWHLVDICHNNIAMKYKLRIPQLFRLFVSLKTYGHETVNTCTEHYSLKIKDTFTFRFGMTMSTIIQLRWDFAWHITVALRHARWKITVTICKWNTWQKSIM